MVRSIYLSPLVAMGLLLGTVPAAASSDPADAMLDDAPDLLPTQRADDDGGADKVSPDAAFDDLYNAQEGADTGAFPPSKPHDDEGFEGEGDFDPLIAAFSAATAAAIGASVAVGALGVWTLVALGISTMSTTEPAASAVATSMIYLTPLMLPLMVLLPTAFTAWATSRLDVDSNTWISAAAAGALMMICGLPVASLVIGAVVMTFETDLNGGKFDPLWVAGELVVFTGAVAAIMAAGSAMAAGGMVALVGGPSFESEEDALFE